MSKYLTAFVAASTFMLAGAAHAADKPVYAPPAKWVQVAEIPAPPADDQAPATQLLLDDNQSLHDAAGSAYYNRRVVKILRSEGLQGGSRNLTWDPERETVTLHSLAIIRDGQRIDLLKDGKDVLVLRREKNLERAMLDGRMTASIQLNDLQVGDTVDWAYTQERRDPVVGGRTNDFERMGWSGIAGRYRVRLLWDDVTPLTWKTTTAFPEPKLSKTGRMHELLVDLSAAAAPKMPVGAPVRFARVGELQATTYRGWEDVSARMAPLYAKAAILAPDSPLRAEIAAIAAANPDAKTRAFAALKLVEDKTRYLFLGMGEGGYRPAAADQTWSRRFGDCKGKTVLLMAILRELGVEAEPVMVMTLGPDGLDQRVPAAAQFNHVLVRARIDGKSYWLDGTRNGDRGGLDTLEPPAWRWGLPVRAAGASLESIEQPPLSKPEAEGVMRIDASAGLDKPASVRVALTLRGDKGLVLARMLEVAPRADLDRQFKQSFSAAYGWITLDRIEWSVSDLGETTMTMVGTAEMEWRLNDDLGVREWRKPGSGAGQPTLFPRREPGPNVDAPYVTPFPTYTVTTTEVVLPNRGAGFTVKGPTFDGRIANDQVRQLAEVKDGVARFVDSARSLGREIPAAEAEAVNRVRRQMSEQAQIVRAPKGA
ncbi:DUF3857 domain-containing protein [Caulobacter sp. 1776]|uniref:DUF3857 domain-containing protein n=1 Tax=Caulobacter sp. 1776 TaxID=3156420 RepID=UPI003393B09B